MKIHQYTIFLIGVILFSCAQPNSVPKDSEKGSLEKHRSKFHFTPPSKWMNDPNGMVYFEDEYHLFYQYYPDSNVWGPMHWGHAVSKDMIAWEHLPIALYPDSLGYIFSGSAVIDWENTSGFGSEDNPAMVAIFTYHEPIGAEKGDIDYQTQGVAYSLDKGRTWTKYEKNPVLANPGIIDFRDPKVSWIEEYQKWVMILAVKDHVNFYTSSNLTEWQKAGEFGHTKGGHGGVWECPDLFKLQDQNGISKWVMLLSINPGGPLGGSATQYFVGDFNGQTFLSEDTVTRWIDQGPDNYAGVTWSDVPESDGRRLFLGWMSNWQYAQVVPTSEWRSAMTIPRELMLNKTKRGYELQSKPIEEIDTYFERSINFKKQQALNDTPYLVSFEVDESQGFQMVLSNNTGEKVTVKLSDNVISFDRSESGIVDFEVGFGVIHQIELEGVSVKTIKVFVDASSLEVFVNNGERVITEIVFPNEPYSDLTLNGGVSNAQLTPLRQAY